MDYRQLGNSGVRVSVIGLGANRFGSDNVPQTEVNRIIDAALDLGSTLLTRLITTRRAVRKRASDTHSRDAVIRSC
jgi:predicted aldo/keto reductase-like oxidoreductase